MGAIREGDGDEEGVSASSLTCDEKSGAIEIFLRRLPKIVLSVILVDCLSLDEEAETDCVEEVDDDDEEERSKVVVENKTVGESNEALQLVEVVEEEIDVKTEFTDGDDVEVGEGLGEVVVCWRMCGFELLRVVPFVTIAEVSFKLRELSEELCRTTSGEYVTCNSSSLCDFFLLKKLLIFPFLPIVLLLPLLLEAGDWEDLGLTEAGVDETPVVRFERTGEE